MKDRCSVSVFGKWEEVAGLVNSSTNFAEGIVSLIFF